MFPRSIQAFRGAERCIPLCAPWALAAFFLASCSPGGSSTGSSGSSGGGSNVSGGGSPGGGSPGDANQPPLAVAAASVTVGEAPLEVRFDSAGSSDPEGSLATFTWDFGDGSEPTDGEAVTHTYPIEGSFLAVLLAADSAGAAARAEILIKVERSSCPAFRAGVSWGSVESSAVIEASGIAASRKNAGVLWVHNDSGDSARLFAVTEDGRDLGTYRIPGASAYDWEDIAVGPGPAEGEEYIFIADIGDNAHARSYVSVYRVPEPAVSVNQAPLASDAAGAVRLDMKYPGGAAYDAETLLVDPLEGDIFVVTKRSDGRSEVYRNPAPHAAGQAVTMQLAASLAFGTSALPGSTLVTAGDISPAGDRVILKTYSNAFIWRRPGGGDLAAAFATEACAVPLRSEPQGEAVGFAANGGGYFTVSEGSRPPLYFFELSASP